LAEAIRRSLEDVETKKAASEEQEIVVDAVKPEAEATEAQNEDDVAVTGSTCEEEEEEEEDFSDCKEDHEEDDTMSVEEEVAIMSVDCPCLEEESVGVIEKPSSPKSPKREKGESFASGASGDLEIFVGETLDRMGEAIEKLQDEDDEDDDDDDEEEDGCEVEANNDGAKIVEGEDDDDESASRGSWSVVDEEQRIARATEALGSALFNSDMMQQSGEQVSALSHSFHSIGSALTPTPGDGVQSNMSSVTSVPSTVRTLTTETEVPQVQLERWAFQLRGLHELGFLNDAMSVDILETLTAANIGVDSKEEVTIQQVVEKYCEGMKEMAKDW